MLTWWSVLWVLLSSFLGINFVRWVRSRRFTRIMSDLTSLGLESVVRDTYILPTADSPDQVRPTSRLRDSYILSTDDSPDQFIPQTSRFRKRCERYLDITYQQHTYATNILRQLSKQDLTRLECWDYVWTFQISQTILRKVEVEEICYVIVVEVKLWLNRILREAKLIIGYVSS